MKKAQYVITVALLGMVISSSSVAAGQAKGGKSKAGGNADAHMSGKARENTNAQWSADPERGWVRSDERHHIHESKSKTKNDKQSRGKHKGNNGKAGNH